MRCVGLAEQLLANGHQVEIFYHECPAEVLAKIPPRTIITEVDDPDFIPDLPERIVVIDSYRLDDERAIKIRDPWWFLRRELQAVRRGRSRLERVLVSFGGTAGSADTTVTNTFPGVTLQAARFPAYAAQLDWADLVVGAAGVSAWERAHFGIPSLITPVVTNQLDNYRDFSRAAAAIPIGNKDDSLQTAVRWLDILRHNPDLMAFISAKAARFAPTDSFADFWREVKQRCLS
jgi:hypothetical protein